MVGAVSKYHKTIRSETVDVYDVLVAFGVTCPALQHAAKKILMPGLRGAKSVIQDLQEARLSIDRAIELEEERDQPIAGRVRYANLPVGGVDAE